MYTLKVHCWLRFKHRVQEAADSPVSLLRLRASQPTLDRRHSSQLENWVRRATTLVCMAEPSAQYASVGCCRTGQMRNAGELGWEYGLSG